LSYSGLWVAAESNRRLRLELFIASCLNDTSTLTTLGSICYYFFWYVHHSITLLFPVPRNYFRCSSFGPYMLYINNLSLSLCSFFNSANTSSVNPPVFSG